LNLLIMEVLVCRGSLTLGPKSSSKRAIPATKRNPESA
jgi:hypothetical protein